MWFLFSLLTFPPSLCLSSPSLCLSSALGSYNGSSSQLISLPPPLAFHFAQLVSSHPAIHSAVQKWPFTDYNPLLLAVPQCGDPPLCCAVLRRCLRKRLLPSLVVPDHRALRYDIRHPEFRTRRRRRYRHLIASSTFQNIQSKSRTHSATTLELNNAEWNRRQVSQR
ncbi:hypothetical protein FA13DRAFT_888447 [Coprinellus micaceus]|uniref:Secreted protein n=1 Tax=Coprinellus micaceus TaxID=71717 RepID=A0A4Y7TU12_COPMI|nr:hypothetical protein FA13DRAFT_888447 [Coprinellus micaceus]